MYITWAGLADTVEADEVIYLADGAVRLRIGATRPGDGEIDATVEIGGSVRWPAEWPSCRAGRASS
jgi:pyruvate kinase